MSPISRDDLHKIFKNLDEHNSGHVSIHELQNLLHIIRVQTTLEELEKLVGRSNLNYVEFLHFYETTIEPGIVDGGDDDLWKAFKVFDANGDGFISCEELQLVLTKMGLWEKTSGKDCKVMIDAYDKNFDGVLDFDEFKDMMSIPPAAAGNVPDREVD